MFWTQLYNIVLTHDNPLYVPFLFLSNLLHSFPIEQTAPDKHLPSEGPNTMNLDVFQNGFEKQHNVPAV